MTAKYIAVRAGEGAQEYDSKSAATQRAIDVSDAHHCGILVCMIVGRVIAPPSRYRDEQHQLDDEYNDGIDDDDPVDDDESEEQAEELTLKDSTIQNGGEVMQFFEGEDGTEYVYKFTVKAKEQSK